LLGQPGQAVLDQVPVVVVAEGADSRLRLSQVLAGAVEIVELSIAVGQVEVQRRIQGGH
jgi:hypothetical protein